ncbi:FAD-dependent oxidoreductase [Microbacterium fluvii]|uniref:FAD-dependent oxidoreductase n=1 Tax=Microbacterium fluvii TaxID=415215 RepID=A0ABW2HBN6_9MICO|nr:flavodoxin reductase [Microbacterium fluvii]MCU4672371.1 flavodoxin reductase [Microbacterium fluvii]
MSRLAAVWNRLLSLVGRFSMYRLVLLALVGLESLAFVLSFFQLVTPSPLALLATSAVLAVSCLVVDLIGQRVTGRVWRYESSLITALILVFVLYPTVEPAGLAGIAIAGAAASASKYLIAWRGRHILNPAALGATVLSIVTAVSGLYALGAAGWWVGTPALAAPVIVLGFLVVARADKLRPVLLFLVIALPVYALRVATAYASAGQSVPPGQIVSMALLSSPFFFLAAFMFSEPLTQPPRRWQQYIVAVVVGLLAGWPLTVGILTFGPEAAVVAGNIVAFAFAFATRARLTLTLIGREQLTPSVEELSFRASRMLRFEAGQYLELEVPHAHADARGTRREFSIVSAPEELPVVKIAMRRGSQSTYKKALAEAAPGAELSVTGVWGDFVLPRHAQTPVVLVAAGIGVTPFVSQLRHLRLAGDARDVVFVYVASGAEDLAFRSDLEDAGIPVVVFTRDEPAGLPERWTWAQGERLTVESLQRAVPDLARRHAYISGPPGLIADLAPALERAHGLTTDAFSGY